ncbi:translational GTPase TypA [Tropheryma whipplei]|uniref:translational GTPase TypA n=1 Tax=Tropheryma whipplei TaxID=2039 RepID=UPI000000C7BB|nr:translational GTPase TypA [Tropheryma whipplei]CAD66846.1 putative transcription factor [Tropheryma whipplei TW08/27]
MITKDIRNIAVVAHVDHGKTTLISAMLQQTSDSTTAEDRVLDSHELEREKGITILAKNTAVTYKSSGRSVTLNIVDTPGHADFGGEVERGMSMVDGVVVLVDASEGPLPQTRFVLKKALLKKLPIVLAVNKTDRSDARIDDVVSEFQDLLISLAEEINDPAIYSILDVPIVYVSGRAGRASINKPDNGQLPDRNNLDDLFEKIISYIPAPEYDKSAPLQAHVANIDASAFLGRLALTRIYNGSISKGQTVCWVNTSSKQRVNVRVTELLKTVALDRVPVPSVSAGDIVAIAGIPDVMIGDSICDPDDVRPLPGISIDEPAISVVIGVNTSPLAGGVPGHKLTATQIKERLDRETIGNVSIRVIPTRGTDAWEVQGRGELALAVLIEQMRREGFELTVGKPSAVTRIVDGSLHEPYELLTVNLMDEYFGSVTKLLAERKCRVESVISNAGWTNADFVVPSRGLIGFRTEFLTITRGTGTANAIFHSYAPWSGQINQRAQGSAVADRAGHVTSYAILGLQERVLFFVSPSERVYEGMVVGRNSRPGDLNVNVTKGKKLTNTRSSTAEELEKIVPARHLSLEECLEFAGPDECVEVTPEAIRIRKIELSQSVRSKQR